MPSIEDIVESQLSGPLLGEWVGALRTSVRIVIGDNAATLIDLDQVMTRPGWDRLEDPIHRANIASRSTTLCVQAAALLDGQFPVLRQAVLDAGHGRQTLTSMRRRIAVVSPALLRLPSSVAQLAASPFASGWAFLADAIARQVYDGYHGRTPTAAREEWRLMNRLILVDYFRQSRLPEARLVTEELEYLRTGLLSIRGTLVCTAGVVSATGVGGIEVPLAAAPTGGHLHHSAASDLVAAVFAERQATAAGGGVMQRVASQAAGGNPVGSQRVQRMRAQSTHRYEHSLIAYMGVAGIEQLLRAWAEREGVVHRRPGGAPESVAVWLGGLNCSPGLEDQIRAIFDPAGANLRNRMMHSGFLLTASKAYQEDLAAADPARYGALLTAPDPYRPLNVANLAVGCLELLDHELAGRFSVVDADFAWAAPWRLTSDEIDFGLHVYCDLVPWPGGPSLAHARRWAEHLSIYFRAVMPGLGQFFRLGYYGFLGRYTTSPVVLLHALGMVFEAIYRLTAHMIGMKILQEDDSASELLVQSLMLSDAALCSDEVLGRFVRHVEEAGPRQSAQRVLRLAVKSRNALAHGAVIRLDQTTAVSMGHLFLKATQALVEAAEFHMTKQAAWFRWRGRCESGGSEHGYDEDDWFNAENEVLDLIDEAGRLSSV